MKSKGDRHKRIKKSKLISEESAPYYLRDLERYLKENEEEVKRGLNQKLEREKESQQEELAQIKKELSLIKFLAHN